MQIDFTPVDVDTGAIKFQDRNREKQRQRRLKRDQEAMEVRRKARSMPWVACELMTDTHSVTSQAKAAARRAKAEKRRKQAAKPEPVRSARSSRARRDRLESHTDATPVAF